MNKIKQQWIIRRDYILGDSTYHQLVLTEGGRYFISLGEIGNYKEVKEEYAQKYINKKLPENFID